MPITIPLTEPMVPRYIYVNPASNQVHIILPVVSGTDIGLDNTCKSVHSLQEFFGKSRDVHQRALLEELKGYARALEFDIVLLDTGSAVRLGKEQRLAQIKQYIAATEQLLQSAVLESLGAAFPAYPEALQGFMRGETNLYSMVLRPSNQDGYLRFIDPVFRVKRDVDSVLYTTLQQASVCKRHWARQRSRK